MDKLTGCCGLDCRRCDARTATVNNDDELRDRVAKLWSELNGAEITREMINCDGCNASGRKTPFADKEVRSLERIYDMRRVRRI